MQSKSSILIPILGLTVLMTAVMLTACSGSNRHTEDTVVTTVSGHDYHADNDIAMTVASIIDALKVNQPLDSAEYNYHGILTDGAGRPLYTDIQGAPGDWEVCVRSPQSVVIRNLYLGDLLPDDLKTYILSGLGIPDTPVMEAEKPEPGDFDRVAVYDFGAGEIIFETQTAKTESDETGPLLTILIRKHNS